MDTCTLILVSILSITTYSQNTYVDTAATCSSCDGSEANPFKTIQEGLDKSGSTLFIQSGTYTGPGNINLTMTNTYSNIYGNGSLSTIIDCENNGHFQGWQLSSGTFTIQGLSIKNCHGIQRSVNYNGNPYGGIWGGFVLHFMFSTNSPSQISINSHCHYSEHYGL